MGAKRNIMDIIFQIYFKKIINDAMKNDMAVLLVLRLGFLLQIFAGHAREY